MHTDLAMNHFPQPENDDRKKEKPISEIGNFLEQTEKILFKRVTELIKPTVKHSS